MSTLVAELDGRPIPLDGEANIESLMTDLRRMSLFDLNIDERRGEERGGLRILYKLLGLSTSNDVTCVQILRSEANSRLVFLTPAGSEHRAFRPERAERQERVSFKLVTGESDFAIAAECLEIEDALRALREFLETRKRPSWLSYKYVR